MFDQEHAHIGRQRGDGGENFMTLVFGDPGRRFVKQKHTWMAGDCDCNFQQTLLAIRQNRGARIDDVGEMKALQNFDHLRNEVGAATNDAPPVEALSSAFGYCQSDCLERRQVAEQLIDLERADDPEAYSLVYRKIADVFSIEHDTTARGPLHAREQID